MNPTRPRPITPTDVVADFDCGTESLNRYLTHRALRNHLSDVSRCYVCVDSDTGRIVGYYTLSAVAVAREQVPGRVRRNTPDVVPAVLLGRLAVDRAAHGSGLGRLLVRDAVLSTLAAAEHIGARILLVHALDERVAKLYARLGFSPSPTDPMHLHVLLADARASLSR